MLRPDPNYPTYADRIPHAVLEKYVADGSFNPEHMAEGDYSCSTAILILLKSQQRGDGIEECQNRPCRSSVHGTSGVNQ